MCNLRRLVAVARFVGECRVSNEMNFVTPNPRLPDRQGSSARTVRDTLIRSSSELNAWRPWNFLWTKFWHNFSRGLE